MQNSHKTSESTSAQDDIVPLTNIIEAYSIALSKRLTLQDLIIPAACFINHSGKGSIQGLLQVHLKYLGRQFFPRE